MKREDILKLAREAGFEEWVIADHLDECERFAALVAAQVVEDTIRRGFVSNAYANHYREVMK
jgi:hypothetical protein